MATFTKNLGLTKPDENDFYNQQTEQCDNWDKIDTWSEGIDNKTKGATSTVPGIVKYGTDVSTALEGSKLAEILGIEYGGVLNNNNQKVAGKGYYDTANKKIYKCTTNTSINYADAAYFIEVSNNDLLGKLQNLVKEIAFGSRIGGNLGKTFSHPEVAKKCKKLLAMELVYSHDVGGTRHSITFSNLNFIEHMFTLQNTNVSAPSIDNIAGVRLLGNDSSVYIDTSPSTGVIAFIKYIYIDY